MISIPTCCLSPKLAVLYLQFLWLKVGVLASRAVVLKAGAIFHSIDNRCNGDEADVPNPHHHVQVVCLVSHGARFAAGCFAGSCQVSDSGCWSCRGEDEDSHDDD